MFPRLVRCAWICSRCQRQLQRRDLHGAQLLELAIPKSQWRYQSNTAGPAEQYVDYVDEESLPHFDESVEAPRYGSRIWRPAQTEKLGLPALGTPAEVLVLPSRDRRIPQIPVGAARSAQGIQASLDSEQNPLTPEEVNENIDHIKAQIQASGESENETFRRLRKSLVKGFRQKQLIRYIESKQRRGLMELKLPKARATWKVRLVNYIILQVWGLQNADSLRTAAEEVELPGPPLTLKISSPVLQTLLVQRGSLLQSLAEKENVRIDSYVNRLIVTPLSGSGHTGLQHLIQMKKSILRSRLEIDEKLRKILPRNAAQLQDLLLQIGRKNEVYIEKQSSESLLIFHRHNSNELVDWITRELVLTCMMTTQQGDECQYRIWPKEVQEELALAPTNMSGSPIEAWSTPLGRWIFTEKPDSAVRKLGLLGPKESGQSGGILNSIQAMMYPRLSLGASEGYRLSARLGQCLFAAGDKPLVTPPVEAQNKLQFSERIPNIAQYLASLQTQTFDSVQASQTFHRLLFHPNTQLEHLPTFEVLLRCDESDSSPGYSLVVQNIAAILASRSCSLLLPGSPLDVLIHEEIVRSLFVNKVRTNHKPRILLLRQLKDYLQRACSQDGPRFLPFVSLQVPKSLLKGVREIQQRLEAAEKREVGKRAAEKEAVKRRDIVARRGGKDAVKAIATRKEDPATREVKDQDMQMESSTLAKSAVLESTKSDDPDGELYREAEYILHSAEIVELNSFDMKGENPPLEHITFHGGAYGPDRQVLQLSHPPTLDAMPRGARIKASPGKVSRQFLEGAIAALKQLSSGRYRGNEH